MTHNRHAGRVPDWVGLSLILIGVGCALFFCVWTGVLRGPSAPTVKGAVTHLPPADALGAVAGGVALAERLRE